MVSKAQWKGVADRLTRREFECVVNDDGISPIVKCNDDMNALPSNQIITATVRTMGSDDEELWVLVNGRHNSNNTRYKYEKQQKGFMDCEAPKFKKLKGFSSIQKRYASYGASVKGVIPTPTRFTEEIKDNISDFINVYAQYITGARKCDL